MEENKQPTTRAVNISTDVYERIAAVAAAEDRTIGKQLERLLRKALEQGITG